MILAALNEPRLNIDLDAQQVFPLVPGRIPQQRQRGFVEKDVQLTVGVSVNSLLFVERELSQRGSDVPEPLIGQERENPGGVEGCLVSRKFSRYEQRAKATVWKDRRGNGISQESVVTRAQFRTPEMYAVLIVMFGLAAGANALVAKLMQPRGRR